MRQGLIYRTPRPSGGTASQVSHLVGSYATRNATTGVHAEPGGDHYIGVCAGRRAEAEGFEPPVPLGTLAFKTQGNRVVQCAPSCLPASSLLKRVPNRAPCGSRLLH